MPETDLPEGDMPQNESTEAGGTEKMGDLFCLLYYHMADEVVSRWGEEGREAVARAIRRFGEARGKKMRQRHLDQGLPINIKTLFTNKDRPGDSRFSRELDRLDEEARISRTLRCPFFERWRELGGVDLARIYCEEVHEAMWETYDPRIVVEQPKIKTRGDDYCSFRVLWDETAADDDGGGCT